MTPNPIPSLPEVLYAAVQAKPCTRRDLERAAALKGYQGVQVEVAISKARKLGLFVQEPMYRLAESEVFLPPISLKGGAAHPAIETPRRRRA